MKRTTELILFLLGILLFGSFSVYADVLPPAANDLPGVSIVVGNPAGGDVFETSLNFGLRVLQGLKTLVSGIALIYIVLMGANMIIFSENEDKIKAQRRQMVYVLIAFLFLNIPGLIYIAFFGPDFSNPSGSGPVIGNDNPSLVLWNEATLVGLNGFVPALIGFFEIFIFGIAILTFTWGFFRLIMSGGDEEVQKKAKNRIINGVLGLMFFGFVKVWGSVIAKMDFFGEFATVSKKALGLALYFAAPVVIGFLVLAAFYMITSAGDEEKIKKAKSIFINTLIAALILLGAYSFVSDLASFVV